MQTGWSATVLGYYKEWWASVAGFAFIGVCDSIGTYFEALSDIDVAPIDDLIGALVSSAVAMYLLVRALKLRTVRQLWCYKLSTGQAKAVSMFMIRTASLGFAAAWEDFCSSLACVAMNDYTSNAAKLDVIWVYASVTIILLLPTALVVGFRAERASKNAEADLLAYEAAEKAADPEKSAARETSRTMLDAKVDATTDAAEGAADSAPTPHAGSSQE